jgi:hypothetical protein
VDRLGAIAAHFHLAAFGFAGHTAVGVGSRMLPMFLVSGSGPEWPVRIIGPVAAVGLMLLGGGLLFSVPAMTWPGALLGVAAAAMVHDAALRRPVSGHFHHSIIASP